MTVQSEMIPKRESEIVFQKWMFLFFSEYSSLGSSYLFIECQEF